MLTYVTWFYIEVNVNIFVVCSHLNIDVTVLQCYDIVANVLASQSATIRCYNSFYMF